MRSEFQRLMVCGFAALLLSLPVAAQEKNQEPAEEDEGAEAMHFADLQIYVDGTGAARAVLSLYQPPEKVRGAREVLARVLGCAPGAQGRELPYMVSLRCEGVFRRRGLTFKGDIQLHPLVEFLRRLEMKSLVVTLSHPAAGFVRTTPAPAFQMEADGGVENFVLDFEHLTTETLHVEFGYESAGLWKKAAPLVAILLLPIGLTLWARRAALRAPAEQRIPTWYGYWRFFEWTMFGTWLVWWCAVEALGISETSRFLLGAMGFVEPVGFTFVHWIIIVLGPPGLLNVICSILSHPVQARVRGTDWTRQDIFRQTVWTQVSSLLPIILGGVAVIYLLRGNFATGVLWLAGALVGRLIAAKKLSQAMDLTPHALTVGELRDRIFALAQKAGVKLQQIFVIPAGKGRLANAFAMQGGNVLLTDYVLHHLSKREVDAVMAHELAHLKSKHLNGIAVTYLLGIGGAVIFYPHVSRLFGLPKWAPVLPLLVVLALLVQFYLRRRYEREADAGGFQLTGDAEAAITGLVKIHRLSLLPIQWSKWQERFSTHPSTVRRAQALAKLGGIAPERLEALLAAPDTPEERYQLPPAFAEGGKVFSTTYKARLNLRAVWTAIAGMTLTPALVAWLVRLGGWEGATRWWMYLAGLGATIGVFLLLANYPPLWGYDDLARKLRAKVEREGFLVEAWRGKFVGLSPGATPRIYEGNWCWDVGFLFLSGDRLCYVGEEARFALRPYQITALRRAPGPAGWWRTERVSIAWKDEERGTSGELQLWPLDARSLSELGRKVPAFAKELETWHTQDALEPIPAQLSELPTPQSGEVTATEPSTLFAPRRVFRSIFYVAIIAAVVAVVTRLPLGLDAVLSGVNDVQRVDASGWYVVFVAVVVGILQFVPHLRKRKSVAVKENKT